MDWHWLTFFGDSMLLLPCAVLIVILLLWKADTRRACWQWLLLFAAAGAMVSVSKLAFMGWGIGSRHYDFTGFSGHSALSASIWPVLIWILCSRASFGWRLTAVAGGYLLALVIGFSRLVLHAHSVSEVIAGLTLGYTISTSFLLMQYTRHTPIRPLTYSQMSAILVLPLLLIVQGKKAPTQGLLEQIAVAVAQVKRPYTRADLHRNLPAKHLAVQPATDARPVQH
ncbi:phosphatase PAP2 family protein [Biostraticola tofi]|uniref:PAP2 superfamily protein n=1 Tax=Biostraticola tofi TaxID=466109 RepID=A0A4R3Z7N0_9GAMM|nr:phosphatase PAP2 family protein [Biostraticola tofi]TCW00221.1 PAP2 superfamily protein [Biostraticola tofi]